MKQPVTQDKLDEFVSRYYTYRSNELYRRFGEAVESEPITYDIGKKYIRIVVGSSAYMFIERATGDIYKSASWKAPAKGARGSIWNPDCDIGDDKPCDLYGGNLYANRG